MEEEINTLVTTGLLFKNDKNPLFIRNSTNTSEYENSSISTKENISDSPNNSFSILVERLYTLQNFLLSEISDIKAEMKKKCNQMASKEISAGNDKKLSFCKIK